MKKKKVPEDLITLPEAAALRGVGVSAVSRLISRGRIQSYEMFGRKLVSKSELKAYRPAKGGRPKKGGRE